MQWIVLTGVKPYDGRYRLDVENERLTTVEWGWIKRFSGYLPTTVEKGYEGMDPELVAALAVIALCRAGKIQTREAADVYAWVAAAPFGDTVGFDNDDPEPGDADPPASTSGNGASSGADSRMSSGSSTEGGPPRTGTPGSATSASDPVTSPT